MRITGYGLKLRELFGLLLLAAAAFRLPAAPAVSSGWLRNSFVNILKLLEFSDVKAADFPRIFAGDASAFTLFSSDTSALTEIFWEFLALLVFRFFFYVNVVLGMEL